MTGGHPILCVQGCVSPCRKTTEADINIHLQYGNRSSYKYRTNAFGQDDSQSLNTKVSVSHYFTVYKYLATVGQ